MIAYHFQFGDDRHDQSSMDTSCNQGVSYERKAHDNMSGDHASMSCDNKSRDESCCGSSSGGCCKSPDTQSTDITTTDITTMDITTTIENTRLHSDNVTDQESTSFVSVNLMREIDAMSSSNSPLNTIQLFEERIKHILSL